MKCLRITDQLHTSAAGLNVIEGDPERERAVGQKA
jgi:hypothetical protein